MDRSSLYNIIHLSLSFVLIFTSYNVTQTFQTSSDYAKHGAFAVGILYVVFCLSNLVLSSFITQLLGVRLTLFLASLAYALFTASSIKYNIWILYVSAFLAGLGSALLWTAQGVYVAISINQHERINYLELSSTLGFMNGIFFGILSLAQTTGNLIASFLFRFNLDQWIIFTIMTVIGGLGSVSLIFLRSVDIPKNTKQGSVLSSLSIFLDIQFVFLIPTICYYGLSQGFIFAAIPPLILNKSRKFLIFALFGITGTCSAIVFGKLNDYFGRRLLFIGIGALAHMIAFGFLLTIWKPPLDGNRIDIFIILISCLSIGDTIFTTQLYSIITMLFGVTRPADAFAAMKTFHTGCLAIGFFGHVYLPFSIQILCLILVLLLSLITLIYGHYGIVSLDTGNTAISMQKRNKNITESEVETQLHLMPLSNTTETPL